MAENIEQKLDGKIEEDKDAYVHNAYENAIKNDYRKSSRNTKRSYKAYRFFSIFLVRLLLSYLLLPPRIMLKIGRC